MKTWHLHIHFVSTSFTLCQSPAWVLATQGGLSTQPILSPFQAWKHKDQDNGASFYCCFMVSSRPSQVSATILKLQLPWLSGQLSPTGQTDHLLVEVANWGRSHQLLRSNCSGTVRTSPNPSPPSSPCRNRRQRWTDHTWPGQLHQACLWPLPLFKGCVSTLKADLGWLNLLCSSQHGRVTG